MADSSNVYANAQPLQGDISNWILNQEQMNMAQDEAKRKRDYLEQLKKEKEQEKADKLRDRLLDKIPKNYDTGSSSLNEFQARIIKDGANRLGEIYIQLKDPNLSDPQRTRLEIEAQNIGNLPENLKLSTDNFTKLISVYKTGVQGGSLWENADFEKKVLSGFENYVGGLDENGLPVVGFTDKDGDGKMDIMSYENLSQGIGVWDFQPKLDYDKMIAETAKNLGTVEEKKSTGAFTDRTTKGIPLEVAQARASALVQDSNGNLTNFAKSTFRQYGIDFNNATSEDIANLEKQVAQDIIMSKDSSDKTDTDRGAQQTAANRAAKDRDDEITNPFTFVEKKYGYTKFSLKEPFLFQSKNKNNQPGTVTSLTVDKNGNIILTASVLKEKKTVKSQNKNTRQEISTTEDVYETIYIKDQTEVASILAGVTKLDSYEAIKQGLNQMANQYEEADDLPDLD